MVGSQDAQGVVQEGALFGSGGDPVGGQKRQGLRVLESVAVDRGEKQLLLAWRERTQGVSKRRADPAVGEGALGEGAESCCDVHSPCHPLGLAFQKARDGGGAQALLVSQGTDDAPLVQGGEGARRAVGREEHALALVGRGGPLHEHGDELPATLPPGLQTFEPVQYFVASVRERDDADGQGRQIRGYPVGAAGAERGVAGPQALGGQEANRPGARRRWAAVQGADLSHGERPRGSARRRRQARRRGSRGCAGASGSATRRGRR